MNTSDWTKALQEYLAETPEESSKKMLRRLNEQWREFFGETYTPITLAGFEEAMAKAEKERGLSRPVTALVANGNQHDFHWMDRNYVAECDPYKEGGKGSLGDHEESSVLTQEQFEAEVKRVAGFYGENLTDEK